MLSGVLGGKWLSRRSRWWIAAGLDCPKVYERQTKRGLRERLVGGEPSLSRNGSRARAGPRLHRGADITPHKVGTHLAAAGYSGDRARMGHSRCGRRSRTGHDWVNSRPRRRRPAPAGGVCRISVGLAALTSRSHRRWSHGGTGARHQSSADRSDPCGRLMRNLGRARRVAAIRRLVGVLRLRSTPARRPGVTT